MDNARSVSAPGFRPLTGISLFLSIPSGSSFLRFPVFVPSRGFLFFYEMRNYDAGNYDRGFRPLTGISLFLLDGIDYVFYYNGFRPLTGISLFLYYAEI